MTPDEIDKLREWVLQNDSYLSRMLPPENVITLLDHIDRLQKQNEIMKQALEWYANWDWSDKYVQAVPLRANKALKDCEEIK